MDARNGARRVLGLTLDSMWSIKDYVLSGAVTALAEDFRVAAWVPGAFVDGTRRLLTCTDGAVIVRPFIGFERSAAFTAVCKLQKSLRFERYDIETEQVMKRRSTRTIVRARSTLTNRLSGLARIAAKSPAAPTLEHRLAQLRGRLSPNGLYHEEFESLGIDLVMTTDPVKRDEDPIYFEAKRRALPRATLVLSWDNLTNKGIIHGRFSQVMVWNDIMRAEIALMYPWYRPEQVSVVGFPRFDVYRAALPARYERAPFLRSLGLDPARPVLLYASSASKGFSAQHQVLEHLCEAIANAELGRGTQLLIRCHPHDEVEEVEAFRARPSVGVWPAHDRVKYGSLYEQLPEADDLLVLRASVAHSAAVIGVGSTVMLDAARCDVPIICIAYDGDLVLPAEDSVASVYNYSHQKAFQALGATDMCRSRDELMASIRRALEQPGRQADRRKTVVDRYLGGYESSIDRIRAVLSVMDTDGCRADRSRLCQS